MTCDEHLISITCRWSLLLTKKGTHSFSWSGSCSLMPVMQRELSSLLSTSASRILMPKVLLLLLLLLLLYLTLTFRSGI